MTDWKDVAAAEINNALQLGLSDREMRKIVLIIARNFQLGAERAMTSTERK